MMLKPIFNWIHKLNSFYIMTSDSVVQLLKIITPAGPCSLPLCLTNQSRTQTSVKGCLVLRGMLEIWEAINRQLRLMKAHLCRG